MNREEQKKHNTREIGRLLKESLKIVDDLGKLDVYDYEDDEKLEDLIIKARKLRRNRLWRLT